MLKNVGTIFTIIALKYKLKYSCFIDEKMQKKCHLWMRKLRKSINYTANLCILYIAGLYTRDQLFDLRQLSIADQMSFYHSFNWAFIGIRAVGGRFGDQCADARVQRNITTPSRDINTNPRDNSKQHNVNIAATEISGTVYRNDRRLNRFVFEVSSHDEAKAAVVSLSSHHAPSDHYTPPDHHHGTLPDHSDGLTFQHRLYLFTRLHIM